MDNERQLTFEEAAASARSDLEAPTETPPTQGAEPETPTEAPAQQPEAEQQTPDQAQMTEQALDAAEQLAGRAEEQNNELQEVRQQLGAVMDQNQQMQEMIRQMSQQQEEHVEEDMQKENSFPVLDTSQFAFASEEELQRMNQEYARQVESYMEQEMNRRMQEIKPYLDEAKAGAQLRERDRVISEMKDLPEFSGIETMSSQLDRIIGNSSLSRDDVPMEEKYAMAYAIAKGVNAINNPPKPPAEPTVEDLMNYYTNNQDFRDMVERKRVEELSKSQQVPPMSASSGAVNAALNIKKKPQTFDDALERSKKDMR